MDAARLVALFATAGAVTASLLAIRGWIKRPLKQLQSHAEFTPSKGYKSVNSGANSSRFFPDRSNPFLAANTPTPANQEAPVTLQPDVLSLIRQEVPWLQKSTREIEFEYRTVSGDTRHLTVMAHSRNLVDGRTYSINCQEQGEQFSKPFLLRDIQSLTVSVKSQSFNVRSPDKILALVEELLPLQEKPIGIQSSEGAEERLPKATTGASVDSSHLSPQSPPPTPPFAYVTPEKKLQILSDLLPIGAKGFAIVDLETTGKESGSCRIVEIGLIRLDPSGHVTEEWDSLINPGCSFDNNNIHGIKEEMVSSAPAFSAIAPVLAAKLDGHILVAHNLHRFDSPVLDRHFKEVDSILIDLGSGIDTMPNPRRKLSALCHEHSVSYNNKDHHTALGDVRALRWLVPKLLQDLHTGSKQVVCKSNPFLASSSCHRLTRARALSSGPHAAASQPPNLTLQSQQETKGCWVETTISIHPGLVFVGTQNKAAAKLAVLQKAEDHLLSLGLKLMVKRARIIAGDLPTFVLVPSLDVTSTKMKDAIRLGVPVVLCRDAMQMQAGGSLKALKKDG